MNKIESTCKLKDRVILITGAAEGIGKSAALSYAAQGATVILLDKAIRKLETLYDDISKANYPQAAIIPLNLTTANPDQYQEIAEKIQSEFGRLDGVLHNAAELGSLTPIEHYDIEQWYKVMQSNLNAVFMMTKVTLPLLKQSHDASIIFTSADVGQQAKAYWGAYSVSKFGNEALMQILAAELSNTSVRVNCIDPGQVDTALFRKAYPAKIVADLRSTDDIMPLYLFLMSAESQGITGQRHSVT